MTGRPEILSPPSVDPFVDEVVRLQRAAYAVEAALVGDDRIPPLYESASDVCRLGLQWYLAVDAGAGAEGEGRVPLLGALGCRVREGVLDIDRLVVDPAAVRRGLGGRLLDRALGDLGSRADTATVSTARDNAPALALYGSRGFAVDSEPEVLEGLWVCELSRSLP